MPYIRRNNISFHYRKYRSENPYAQETLILLHGLGPDMNSWQHIVPYFLRHYHVFMYDLRGFGKSEPGNETLSLDLLTEDLAFLINVFDIRNYHLITQGFSGFIGVRHAGNQHTQNMQTLTLMTAPVYFPKKLGNNIIQRRREWVEEVGSLHPLAKMIITQNCYPLTEEKAAVLFEAYDRVAPEDYFALFRNHFEDDAAEQLGRVHVPTLMLSGAEDTVYPPELFGASVQLYPNAKHFIVPNASFMMQMDQPGLVSDWIHQFIEKSTSKPDQNYRDYRQKLNDELYREINSIKVHTGTLDVNCMNGFSVYLGGQRVHGQWSKRKAMQLLVYLAMKQSVTREELCDVFWPETDLKSAKNSLRVALHHLKKLFETNTNTPILESDKEFVFLRGHIQCDIRDYMEKIKHAHQLNNAVARAESYRQLLREAPDNPLPGLYDEWFIDLRNYLEQEQGTMALFLADYHEKNNDRIICIDYMKLAVHYYQNDIHLQERLSELETRIRIG
ncbi:hypothetical protein GCM10009001_35850 [Virgibacillus siamensis]|uniref:AB hydrolase-1 domain-containing protein n=1 Tax=Virgibacillus siamensis TaxID=480071 RepID=A0ABN1GNV1_9BACI